jgi:hypothetical protein
MLATTVVMTPIASAAPTSVLEYQRGPGAESCPEVDAIRIAVERRLGYDPFSPDARRTFLVTIAERDERLTGRIVLFDDEGRARGLREVSAERDRCHELVETLALSLSLAIDPARTEPSALPPASSAAQPAPQPVAAAELPSPAPVPPPSLETIGLRGRVLLPERPNPTRWSVGLGTYGTWRVEPGLAAGGLVFASLHSHDLSLGLELAGDLPRRDPDWGFRSHTLGASVVPCHHFGSVFGCAVVGPGAFFASDAKRGSAFFLLLGARFGGELRLSEQIGLVSWIDLLNSAVRPRVKTNTGETWEGPWLAGSVAVATMWHFR